MNKLIYYRTLLLGAVIGIVFVSFFYVFTHDEPNKQPITPKSNFEVVDHYKGCDLLRWTNSHLSNYQFVLYCPK